LRSEHRSSVIAGRPPNRDQARVHEPARRMTLWSGHAVCHWRTYAALDSAGNFKPGWIQKSLGHLSGPVRLLLWWAVSRRQTHPCGMSTEAGVSAVFRPTVDDHLLSVAFKPHLGSLSARRFCVGGPCRFCGVGSNLSYPFGAAVHLLVSTSLPRGEGRICPFSFAHFCAEQFVIAAALTPTLRPWWLVHAFWAFERLDFPDPRMKHLWVCHRFMVSR
jgi:hypothetical protein